MVIKSEIRNPHSEIHPIAWVTGGGTGIGKALALRLYGQGWRVVITGRRPEKLKEAVEEIRSTSGAGEVLSMLGDASDSRHAVEVVNTVDKQWGKIQLLVNNAGHNDYISFLDATLEDYRKSFEINCLSAVSCASAVLPGMLGISRGTIVNISSILGQWGSSGSPTYSTAKYATTGFTDVLRQHLVGTPIHVLGVYPGYIQTDMTMPHVQAGSPKTLFSKTPDQMAVAILKAIRWHRSELYFPWYVPWLLRMHRLAPKWSDRLARSVKR